MKLLLTLITCALSMGLTAKPKVQFVQNLKAGKEQTLVTFGTSLTAVGAWVGQLDQVLQQQFGEKVNLVNGAQGGANSAWGVKSLEQKVLKHEPDTVFIEFAINDAVARRRTSVDDARGNLENIITRILEQNPNCEIILMTMNVPVGHTGVQRPNIDAYYQMYRDVAQERGYLLIDHNKNWKKLLDENPGKYLQHMPDAIHPVYAGALEVITPHMVEVLGLEPGDPKRSKDAPCWRYMFGSMDKLINKDRSVSLEEYQLFWTDHFKMQDANKDGLIQANEYPEQGIFNHLDANQDQSVSPEEYQSAYANHFDQFSNKGSINLKTVKMHEPNTAEK